MEVFSVFWSYFQLGAKVVGKIRHLSKIHPKDNSYEVLNGLKIELADVKCLSYLIKHTHTHTHIYVCIYTHMHACMHAYIYIYIYTHTHTYIYIYIYIYTHTHTYTYIYIYIYIYIYWQKVISINLVQGYRTFFLAFLLISLYQSPIDSDNYHKIIYKIKHKKHLPVLEVISL